MRRADGGTSSHLKIKDMKKPIDLETTGEGNIVRQDGFSEPEKTETGAGLVGRVTWISLFHKSKLYQIWKFVMELPRDYQLLLLGSCLVALLLSLLIVDILCSFWFDKSLVLRLIR